MRELEKYGEKQGCWIWWIFPNDRPGMCDPYETYVTTVTCRCLFGDSAAEKQWREVMEKICDLVEKKGMNVLPSIDHGRVHFFLKFWKEREDVPTWLSECLERLDKVKWPPR